MSKTIAPALAFLVFFGCSTEQEFSGSGTSKSATKDRSSSVQPSADATKRPDLSSDEPKKQKKAKDNDGDDGGEDDDGDGDESLGRETNKATVDKTASTKKKSTKKPDDTLGSVTDAPPVGSITKGSFTAWTEPMNPAPREDYWIHIEVKLPSNVGSYGANDLYGRVVGTDDYTRGIGRDSRGALENPPPWIPAFMLPTPPDDRFSINGRIAKISVWVPGARQLVQDRIHIGSSLLKEEQDLAIVF